jgi:hypothetical protein
MAVRIERDGAWWARVAAHEAVAAHIGVSPAEVALFACDQRVVPLAAEHGGFLFRNLDGLGFVFELHTLFTPEGWGREVAAASHEAFRLMFGGRTSAIVTHEQRDWWRSVPPKSHGWTLAGDWRETPVGELRMWILTLSAWAASPAVKRSARRCH